MMNQNERRGKQIVLKNGKSLTNKGTAVRCSGESDGTTAIVSTSRWCANSLGTRISRAGLTVFPIEHIQGVI